jgi:magnesium-transporting ATPase (P-type)
VFHSLNVRSDTHSIFSKQIDMNKWLPIAMCISISVVVMLAMISMYVPNAHNVLGMDNMNWQPWLVTVVLAVGIIPIVETFKLLKIN